jgi:hypothetical protein
MFHPVTRKGRKYVPIQIISPVPVANSNDQKEETKSSIRCINQQPYINEVKEKAAEKKKKQELRKSGRYVRKWLQLDSENMFQEKLFHEGEDCPCLYCNELFSSSKPGES